MVISLKHTMRSFALLFLLGIETLATPIAHAQDSLTEMEQAIAKATDMVYPALVHLMPVSEDFSSGRKRQVTSGGSGVIFTSDGLVITNYHVISNAKLVFCTLSDRTQYRASIVGGDPETDVAVVRIETTDAKKTFPFASLGDSDTLRLGQYVLAMGSPFGFKRSVSLGIVSSVDRYLPDTATLPTGEQTGSFNAWIQTDAAINFGNSGGPLVNLSGEVVGINSRVLIFGNNIGFSIPSNVVRSVAESIRQHGQVPRSFLGLELQQTSTLTRLAETAPEGVLVSGIHTDSPLSLQGMEPGVLLLSINGTPLNAPYESDLPAVRKCIADLPVGEKATLRFRPIDGGPERTITATTTLRGTNVMDHFDCPGWGFTAREYTPSLRRSMGLKSESGALLLGILDSGAAATAGLDMDDLIVAIDEKPIKDLADLKTRYAALNQANASKSSYKMLVTVERKRLTKYFLLTVENRDQDTP